MPCDPYTELEYFHTIARMVECVENVADLVLMGIKPTYPSAKYGYVVPFAEGEKYQIVKRFTEKPDVPTAEKTPGGGVLTGMVVSSLSVWAI